MGMIGNTLALGLVSGANIQDGTVDTVDLKDAAVTPAKMNFSAGVANGVPFLNASKVLGSSSALTFDGSTFAVSGNINLTNDVIFYGSAPRLTSAGYSYPLTLDGQYLKYNVAGSEQMRLTSTGLGIGTSSPSAKLHIADGQIKIANTGAVNPSINFSGNGSGASGFQIGQAYNSQTLFIYDIAAAATRLTVDTSGNLGLGVTPSAWANGFRASQVGLGAAFSGRTSNITQAFMSANFYNDGSARYIGTGEATLYQMSGGQHQWFNAPTAGSGAGNPITFTQAMTLDASGNLSFRTGSTTDVNFQNSVGTTIQRLRYADSDGSLSIGGGTATAYPLKFFTGSTQAMTLDANGNWGLGTTSTSAWRMHVRSAANGTVAAFGSAGGTNQSFGYVNVSDSVVYFGADGASVYPAIGFLTGGLERARIDSSGNFGIGTTSPGAKLDVSGAGRFNSSGEALTVGASTLAANTAQYFRNTSGYGVLALTSASDQYLGGVVAGDFVIASNGKSLRFGNAGTGTLGATLDSSGNLLVGTTSQISGTQRLVVKAASSTTAASFGLGSGVGISSDVMYFFAGTTIVGYIAYNGTNTQYITTSDVRLKENIVEAPGALAKVKSLSIKSYNWKDSKKQIDYGFIAQEVFEVEPNAVSVGKDNKDGELETPWGVDNSMLVPMLTKALQEQQAIIESLTTRLAALEAK